MAVGQVTVAFRPVPNHFHALKDHGEREVCGQCPGFASSNVFDMAFAAQRKEKCETVLHASESFTTSVDGTIKPTTGSITETQTPAAIMRG